MKKIILGLTFFIATLSIIFTTFKVINYYNNKTDDNKLKVIEEDIKKIEKRIEENKLKEESIRNDKKDEIEEYESWKKKRKEMEENL